MSDCTNAKILERTGLCDGKAVYCAGCVEAATRVNLQALSSCRERLEKSLLQLDEMRKERDGYQAGYTDAEALRYELQLQKGRLSAALEEIMNTTPSGTPAWKIAKRTLEGDDPFPRRDQVAPFCQVTGCGKVAYHLGEHSHEITEKKEGV